MEARKVFLISLTDFGVRIKILYTEFDASFIRRCSQLGVNSQFHLDHYDEKNGPWVYLFYDSYVDPVEKIAEKTFIHCKCKITFTLVWKRLEANSKKFASYDWLLFAGE